MEDTGALMSLLLWYATCQLVDSTTVSSTTRKDLICLIRISRLLSSFTKIAQELSSSTTVLLGHNQSIEKVKII